jgi:hypothetical protein
MLPDDAFLRRIPHIVNPRDAIHAEALVFAADTVETSAAVLRRIAIELGSDICNAPRAVHTEIFTHVWAVVNSLDVVRARCSGF